MSRAPLDGVRARRSDRDAVLARWLDAHRRLRERSLRGRCRRGGVLFTLALCDTAKVALEREPRDRAEHRAEEPRGADTNDLLFRPLGRRAESGS